MDVKYRLAEFKNYINKIMKNKKKALKLEAEIDAILVSTKKHVIAVKKQVNQNLLCPVITTAISTLVILYLVKILE